MIIHGLSKLFLQIILRVSPAIPSESLTEFLQECRLNILEEFLASLFYLVHFDTIYPRIHPKILPEITMISPEVSPRIPEMFNPVIFSRVPLMISQTIFPTISLGIQSGHKKTGHLCIV